MVTSYLDNPDYGYDQISVGTDEYNRIIDTLDTNSINDIDTIRERELRMFKKLNEYKPHVHPTDQYKPLSDCHSNKIPCSSLDRDQHRINTRANIENHYIGSGSELKEQLEYDSPKKYFPTYPNLFKKPTPSDKQIKKLKKKETKEGFYNDLSDLEYLQVELDRMEQKNNMFVIFIFFLVIVVLVQYAKSNNDPMRIVLIPSNTA